MGESYSIIYPDALELETGAQKWWLAYLEVSRPRLCRQSSAGVFDVADPFEDFSGCLAIALPRLPWSIVDQYGGTRTLPRWIGELLVDSDCHYYSDRPHPQIGVGIDGGRRIPGNDWHGVARTVFVG